MEQQVKAMKRSVTRAGSDGTIGPLPAGKRSSTQGGIASTSTGTGARGHRDGAVAPPSAGKPGAKGMRIGNVYQPECPAQRALETIASKWAVLILHSLLEKPLRFNALQRKLTGISQKVLTEQLRRLERFGIIARTVHPTVPPSVEYSLTDAGRDLKGALGGLCDWSNKHAALLIAGEASSAVARGEAKSRALKNAGVSKNGSL